MLTFMVRVQRAGIDLPEFFTVEANSPLKAANKITQEEFGQASVIPGPFTETLTKYLILSKDGKRCLGNLRVTAPSGTKYDRPRPVYGSRKPPDSTPCKKKRYNSPERAKHALRRLRRSDRERIPIRYYPCSKCNGYHVTSQEMKGVD